MEMTKTDLDAFARAELVKLRFIYTGWQLEAKPKTLVAHCKLSNADMPGMIRTKLAGSKALPDSVLISMARESVRDTWPYLDDWVLLSTWQLKINHKSGEGKTGSITVDLPKEVPPVVDADE